MDWKEEYDRLDHDLESAHKEIYELNRKVREAVRDRNVANHTADLHKQAARKNEGEVADLRNTVERLQRELLVAQQPGEAEHEVRIAELEKRLIVEQANNTKLQTVPCSSWRARDGGDSPAPEKSQRPSEDISSSAAPSSSHARQPAKGIQNTTELVEQRPRPSSMPTSKLIVPALKPVPALKRAKAPSPPASRPKTPTSKQKISTGQRDSASTLPVRGSQHDEIVPLSQTVFSPNAADTPSSAKKRMRNWQRGDGGESSGLQTAESLAKSSGVDAISPRTIVHPVPANKSMDTSNNAARKRKRNRQQEIDKELSELVVEDLPTPGDKRRKGTVVDTDGPSDDEVNWATSADFKFRAICTYSGPSIISEFYTSQHLEGVTADLWERIDHTKGIWERKFGEYWQYEIDRRNSGPGYSCVTRKCQQGGKTAWGAGRTAGSFACRDCVKQGLPCFTYAIEDGKMEFQLLPLHEDDRVDPVVEDFETRWWINEESAMDVDEGDMDYTE